MRNKKKHKRNAIFLFSFLVLSWLTGLYAFFFSSDAYAVTVEEIEFEKETAYTLPPSQAVLSVHGLEQRDTKYLALHNDPQIFILPPVNKISSTLIELSQPVSANSYIQIYYAENNEQLSEEKSAFAFIPKGSAETIVNLPSATYTSLRYDINILNEEFEIKNIYFSEKAAGKKYTSQGKGDFRIFFKVLISNFLITILWILGSKIGYIDKFTKRLVSKLYDIRQSRNKIQAIVDFAIDYRIAISLLFFSALVLFEIHGSSIDMWNTYIPNEQVEKNYKSPLFGTPRQIRTDEWQITTPIRLAQIMNRDFFPNHNNNISLSGANMPLFHAPVFSLPTIAIPSHWGFFAFNKARGVSWNWWSRFFLLLLSSFEICMFLTGKDKKLSLLGSFLVTFAPPVQWWYSTELVDIIYTGQIFIAGITYYIKNIDNTRKKIIFAAITSLSAVGFSVNLYPSFMIPMFYFIIAFLLALFITYRKKIILRRSDVLIISLAVLISLLLLIHYLFSNLDSFQKMMETIYPGNTFFYDENLSIKLLFTDITCWLLPYKDFPVSNNCEYSKFITCVPLVFILGLLTLFSPKKNEVQKVQTVLFIFLLFQIACLMIALPPFVSKITLLYMVRRGRMYIITGLTATYLALSFFAFICKKNPFKLKTGIATGIIIALLYMYMIIPDALLKDYLGKFHIITALFFITYNFVFVLGHKKLFYIFTLAIIIVSIPVNPIARGLNSIYNKKLAYDIQQITEKEPEKWWISTINWFYGNYLAALGAKTMNATNMTPDFRKYEILDPGKKYNTIYNRYAHQFLQVIEEQTSFELLGFDGIAININKQDILKLGISFILANVYDNLSRFNDDTISFEPVFHRDFFVIYKVHKK